MFKSTVLCFIFVNNLIVTANYNPNEKDHINIGMVSAWAQKLGGELFNFGEYVTRMRQVEDNYKKANIVDRDGKKLVEDIAKDINVIMEMKISAVQRIMDAAENTAISRQDETVPSDYKYYNAKMLVQPPIENITLKRGYRVLELTRNEHFYNEDVNINYSAVHVPTNVYDESKEVIKAIHWSEDLDSIFKSNYKIDPSLSWQYFGSSTGFMRQFPAIEWKQEHVDLFDCRTRSWYIEAATSPKDIVILVDNSGSMTGIKKEIARHVVNNILDTLGNNDFVNIFKFSNGTHEVVPCFSDLLVQATLANIRELKLGMENIDTQYIANFSAALIKAFKLLQDYRTFRDGARCNQAIMLITDGVPYNHYEIFAEYNWQNNKSMMPVRVFTYLIGREVPDVRDVKWMACANKGYYVHLSTLAEVREQVLQYVPVMARPMVLMKAKHPTIWTPVYADITDPKMTDWLWEVKEREEQKESFISYRRDRNNFISKKEQDKRFIQKLRRKQDQHGDLQTYKLMTSVSMPVFDRRENAVSSDRETNGTRVANLLGVAGTDVPIEEIQQLMMPHKLGVNGYAFIITNNGYILVHPDLRPVFQGILKPSYNSVDMIEVELLDNDRGPRDFDSSLLSFREDVINQVEGSRVLAVKYHYDDMKRVSRIRRRYFYTGIKETPFSLVVTIPEPYGLHRVVFSTLEDVHRQVLQGSKISEYFAVRNWVIHPDWTYCKYWRYDDNKHKLETPEDELLHFLDRMGKAHWKWLKRTAFTPEMSNSTTGKMDKMDRDYYCDRDLVQSLVNDANITSWFSNNISDTPKEDKRNEFIQHYGLTVVFLSTHSGLTRWQDFPHSSNNEATRTEPHFSEIYKRSIDEIWYKRAVEQYFINTRSFVYSVPIDAGDRNDTLVTASHAIFKIDSTNENIKAPAAVVGFQFHHRTLYNIFKNITSSCVEHQPCIKTCSSDDLDCYILDNNGYIIVSENMADTGKFYGEVDAYIMEMLVREEVYNKLNIVDYQAVCFEEPKVKNPASIIGTPFRLFDNLIRQFVSCVIWLLARMLSFTTDMYGYGFALEDFDSGGDSDASPTVSSTASSNISEKEFDRRVLINRTRPIPCDREVTLYQMKQYPNKLKSRSPYGVQAQPCIRDQDMQKNKPFVVQQISNSNMILLIVDALCKPSEYSIPVMSTIPRDLNYNSSESLACYKVKYSEDKSLPRRKPDSCISRHMNETQIKLCGRGTSLRFSKLHMVLLILVYVFHE